MVSAFFNKYVTMQKFTVVGSVSKLFGAGGELFVKFYDTFPADFRAAKTPLFVKIDGLDVPLFVGSLQRRGKSGGVVVFDDIDTETRAQMLVGLDFSVRGESFAPAKIEERAAGEIYMEDLVGYTADLGGGKSGVIKELVDSDLNPLFRVDVGGQEVLVPAADDFIVKIRARKQVVEFELPDGLLELYLE